MKILMIAPTPFFSHRGTHIRIYEEARALEKRGHSITIVTYHNGDDIERYVDTTIDVRRIRRWLFWYKKTEAGADWQKILLNLFLIRKGFAMMRTQKPDVIHGHLHEGVIIGRLLQVLFFWRRTPLIADFHGSLVGEMRSHGYLRVPPLGTIFRFLERWINSMGDAAIISSAENRSVIQKARGDVHAYHIYDGVNVADYDRVRRQRNMLLAKYGIPHDAFVVVYTGALIMNKGVDQLLKAATKLVGKDVYMLIGGFPDAWVRTFVKEHHLEDVVHVHSPLNYFHLPEVNIMASAAVDPKVDDSQTRQASGKILQYMAAGVPIICADRKTNRKYLDDAGVYVDAVTPDILARTILDLASKPDVCARKGRHAQARAAVFSWDKVGEKIEGVYQSVIRKNVLS